MLTYLRNFFLQYLLITTLKSFMYEPCVCTCLWSVCIFRMCIFMCGQRCTGASTHLQMWADGLECWTSLALLFQKNLSLLCGFTASCAVRTQVNSCLPVPCHLKRTLNVEVANQSQLLDAFRRSLSGSDTVTVVQSVSLCPWSIWELPTKV